MFHDQGLPVLKHAGFGDAVNVTLGLPLIRTSVDHGTALDLAGTGTRRCRQPARRALRLAAQARRSRGVIRARKRFGQHFLHDPRRAGDASPRPWTPRAGEHIVEIGPGPGALTAHAAAAACASLDAVEIDRDLAAALRERWPAGATPA